VSLVQVTVFMIKVHSILKCLFYGWVGWWNVLVQPGLLNGDGVALCC